MQSIQRGTMSFHRFHPVIFVNPISPNHTYHLKALDPSTDPTAIWVFWEDWKMVERWYICRTSVHSSRLRQLESVEYSTSECSKWCQWIVLNPPPSRREVAGNCSTGPKRRQTMNAQSAKRRADDISIALREDLGIGTNRCATMLDWRTRKREKGMEGRDKKGRIEK